MFWSRKFVRVPFPGKSSNRTCCKTKVETESYNLAIFQFFGSSLNREVLSHSLIRVLCIFLWDAVLYQYSLFVCLFLSCHVSLQYQHFPVTPQSLPSRAERSRFAASVRHGHISVAVYDGDSLILLGMAHVPVAVSVYYICTICCCFIIDVVMVAAVDSAAIIVCCCGYWMCCYHWWLLKLLSLLLWLLNVLLSLFIVVVVVQSAAIIVCCCCSDIIACRSIVLSLRFIQKLNCSRLINYLINVPMTLLYCWFWRTGSVYCHPSGQVFSSEL